MASGIGGTTKGPRFGLARVHAFRRHPHGRRGIDSVLEPNAAPTARGQDITAASAAFSSIFPTHRLPTCRHWLHRVQLTACTPPTNCCWWVANFSLAQITQPSRTFLHTSTRGYMQERMVPEHLGRRRPQRMAARPISKDHYPSNSPAWPMNCSTGAKCCSSPSASPRRFRPRPDGLDASRMAMGRKTTRCKCGWSCARRIPLHHQTHGHTALGGRRAFHQGGRSPSRQPRPLGLVHGTALGRGFYVRHPEMSPVTD